jgi:RNA polymerase sigma-70 factor (ECF subfamily)
VQEDIDDDAKVMAAFVETKDRRMFERLFQKHKRAMVAYAGRYVKDRGRAEELAQEIFVRVYTTKHYQPDATFKTWLYRVATNVCLNELRRPEHRYGTEPLDQSDGSPRPIASDRAVPEAAVAGQELAAALGKILAQLPEKQRAAFLMARFEALSHEEIAAALDTSVSAVKSLIHRALETMRREAAALLAEGGGAGRLAKEAQS